MGAGYAARADYYWLAPARAVREGFSTKGKERVAKREERMLSDRVRDHLDAFNTKCENLTRIVDAHIGYCVILLRPDVLALAALPNEFVVQGVPAKTAKVLGAILKPSDRDRRVDEVLNAAKRVLLADGFDQLVESFCRAHAIVINENHEDPYERDDWVDFTGRRLFNDKCGEARYFTDEEREFLKSVAAPIRNAIRHNNGKLPPARNIDYNSNLHGVQVEVRVDSGQVIGADLRMCVQGFNLMCHIGKLAFERLLEVVD